VLRNPGRGENGGARGEGKKIGANCEIFSGTQIGDVNVPVLKNVRKIKRSSGKGYQFVSHYKKKCAKGLTLVCLSGGGKLRPGEGGKKKRRNWGGGDFNVTWKTTTEWVVGLEKGR